MILGGGTPVHYAAFEGYTHVGQILLDVGSDPNEIDDDSITPLILAAQLGHTDMVKFLLDAPRSQIWQRDTERLQCSKLHSGAAQIY